MNADQEAMQRRQNFLSVFLTGLAGMFFLLVLVLITGGFFVYVVAVAGAIVGFAGLHYLLWGKLLSDQVAGEREEEQLREQAAAAPVAPAPPNGRVYRR
jgi:hypothetical protein